MLRDIPIKALLVLGFLLAGLLPVMVGALVSFEVGHVDEYTNYRLHQDVIIQAETADHQPVEMDVVRTVVERNGRFKVYSTRD